MSALLAGANLFIGLQFAAAETPVAIPTFECIGLYWKVPGTAPDKECEAGYRPAGGEWKQALPLWFDTRDQEYRGSIVNLQPDTTYEIRLQLKGTSTTASLQARTWSETFQVARKVGCAANSNEPLVITESGSPGGFMLYEPGGGATSVIDVASAADNCIVVKGSYVILRRLTLKGARVHAILLREGVHDVVIEDCDISGWGRIAEDGWGKDYDAAIYSRDEGVKRIVVQRNRIHHPRSNSNNWQQSRPAPGKRESSHPEGPQAVCLWDSEGNHVIRYNTVFSDDEHQYNDIFGAGHNFSTRGFPNRDSDIYGNLLSHCWDDAIESEGANCNVRIWGNYISDSYVGVAAASTSIGPLYVWRNVTGVIRESPTKVSGAFFKTSDKTGGGKIYVFHNTVLQPPNPSDSNKTSGAVVGLGWGGPMTNVVSRNNILNVTRSAISDRAHDPLGNYDYDLFSAPIIAREGQEKHGLRAVPVYVPQHGIKGAQGIFALAPQSPGLDAGVAIPNFNDGFIGSGPDIGAHEAGSTPMEFGVGAYRSRTNSTASKQTNATTGEMLENGGMEGAFVNGLAPAWVANCYGSNEVVFAQELSEPHSGTSAQRVTCTRFVSGGVQFHSSDIAIENGKPYTLSLWMKGDVKGAIYVGIRKHGEPYTPYLKRDVRLRSGWTPCLITGQVTESDPRCGVYIMFAGTGTLLVDDVSLKPGVHQDAIVELAGPAQKGNRVYNSGFEAGPAGWAPVGGFVLDDQAPHSGHFSPRVEAGQVQGGPGGIECRPFPVRTGRRYTLTAWIKAAEPNTRVRLRLFEWADNGGDFPANRHERQATVMAATDWARYQLSGIVLPNLHEGYVARIVPSSRIWIDDVQVEEGEATDYQPAHRIEVGAETPTRWCRVGETVEVAARVVGLPEGPIALTYTLEDLWSRPVTNFVRQIKTGQVDRAQFLLTQPGMYRVRVRAAESPATGEVWFGVFPQRGRGLRPESPFGTHVTSVLPEPGNTLLASAAMGARWVRLHDFGDFCHWYRVEPRKGQFVWHDAEIDALRDRGFLVFANLGHPPRWAGRGDQQSGGGWTPAPPRDVSDWENYVFRTVEHYRGKIRHWEVWNEPYWTGFFTGTPEEYANLLKVACRAVKRADPEAIVVGGCFTPTGEDWTRRVLAAGALEFMDVLSYHVYWSPPLTESEKDATPAVAQHVERFAELMSRHGARKPIYMTEGGIRCPPFASWVLPDGFERSAPFGSEAGAGVACSPADAAAGLVRGMVEMLSAGAEKVFYYYSGHVSSAIPWFSGMANGYYVLLDYAGRPKPTMMAYSALEWFAGDATPKEVVRRDGVSVHLFARDNGAVGIAWSTRARPLRVPAGVSAFDLMGCETKSPAFNPGEPVYLVATNMTPAQLKNALR